MKIAVDVFGGDYAPQATIEGSLQALQRFADIELVLFGDEEKMRQALSAYPRRNKAELPCAIAPR